MHVKGSTWKQKSNDSLPVVRHVLSRTYDPIADEIHYFAPVHDIGFVGTEPELRNAQEEDAMRAAAKGAMNGANAQGEAASASQNASESHVGQTPARGA
eukprot:353546-Lingulodinium_polyedra.AAC.1